MVTQLHRKVWRDLFHLKWQAVTIALVIASGVAALVTSMSTHDSLLIAQNRFYYEGRFADIFAELKRAPLGLTHRLAEIPGVVNLETRITKDFLLDLPGRALPAVGRFISVPPDRPPRLNRLYLREGRMLDPTRGNEVLISEGFAEANGFRPGDQVAAIINGKYETLEIVGTALSPEYIYTIRGGTAIPDDRQFGIFWMAEESLAAALDMDGSFNSLSLILGPGSSEAAVIDALDRELASYGGLSAYAREDQLSHRFLSDEIEERKVMAIAIPLIFLAVAAFLLNVVIGRLIALQRSQIATLKAVGYNNLTVALHYLTIITLITALGLLIGIGAGIWLGRNMTELYTEFYRFPVMTYSLGPRLLLLAISVSYGAALIGSLTVLRRVFRMPPAEAMRPAAPPTFHGTWSERFGISRLFSPPGKIVFRNLTRRPLRTTLGIVGIAFAVMITMLGLFWWDTIRFIIYAQFSLAQRDHATVVFVEHTEDRALRELQHYPGVLTVEGYRSVPIRMSHRQREQQTALLGFPPDSRMRLLLDEDLNPLPYPSEGLVLSKMLAKRLAVQPGEVVGIEVLEGKRQQWHQPVTGIVDEWIGYAAYMNLNALHRRLGDRLVTAAALNVDTPLEKKLYTELKAAPAIAAVNVKSDVLRMFKKTMIRFIIIFAGILTGFAMVIAIGVVYNSARVTLSERARELMSLRVLGFSRSEVFRILRNEIAFYTVSALPLGWCLGYLFAWLMIRLLHTETFAIPLILERSTYAYSSLVVLISAVISIVIVRRRLNEMNLVSALKGPE